MITGAPRPPSFYMASVWAWELWSSCLCSKVGDSPVSCSPTQAHSQWLLRKSKSVAFKDELPHRFSNTKWSPLNTCIYVLIQWTLRLYICVCIYMCIYMQIKIFYIEIMNLRGERNECKGGRGRSDKDAELMYKILKKKKLLKQSNSQWQAFFLTRKTCI